MDGYSLGRSERNISFVVEREGWVGGRIVCNPDISSHILNVFTRDWS